MDLFTGSPSFIVGGDPSRFGSDLPAKGDLTSVSFAGSLARFLPFSSFVIMAGPHNL